MSRPTKALFLDRDGTLIEHIPYLHDPRKVHLIPGVQAALRKAMAANFLLFLLSNQSGVGRGIFGMQEVEACNQRMLELLDLPAPGFTGLCIAPESPDEVPVYRKPNPRYINEMVDHWGLEKSACWMIGDSECDVLAGKNAGINSIQVGEKTSLLDAVESILEEQWQV